MFSEMAGPSYIPSQTNFSTSAKLTSYPASCRTPTSTTKTLSISSSQLVSKHSWTGTIEPESTHIHAAAMTGMMGAIHHMSNLIKQALSSTSSSPPPLVLLQFQVRIIPSSQHSLLTKISCFQLLYALFLWWRWSTMNHSARCMQVCPTPLFGMQLPCSITRTNSLRLMLPCRPRTM